MKNKIIMFVAGLFLLLAMTGCNTNPKVEEEINECDTLEVVIEEDSVCDGDTIIVIDALVDTTNEE